MNRILSLRVTFKSEIFMAIVWLQGCLDSIELCTTCSVGYCTTCRLTHAVIEIADVKPYAYKAIYTVMSPCPFKRSAYCRLIRRPIRHIGPSLFSLLSSKSRNFPAYVIRK